jgi:hypothetical protein
MDVFPWMEETREHLAVRQAILSGAIERVPPPILGVPDKRIASPALLSVSVVPECKRCHVVLLSEDARIAGVCGHCKRFVVEGEPAAGPPMGSAVSEQPRLKGVESASAQARAVVMQAVNENPDGIRTGAIVAFAELHGLRLSLAMKGCQQ